MTKMIVMKKMKVIKTISIMINLLSISKQANNLSYLLSNQMKICLKPVHLYTNIKIMALTKMNLKQIADKTVLFRKQTKNNKKRMATQIIAKIFQTKIKMNKQKVYTKELKSVKKIPSQSKYLSFN